MKTKTQRVVMLAVAALALSSVAFAPAQELSPTGAQVKVKKLLSRGPHLPPITAPQTGGAPPACPTGYTCN
jgi:hypothetical protein